MKGETPLGVLNRSQRRWAYVLAAVLAIGTPLLALAQEASAPSPAPEPPRKEGRLHLVFFGSETNVPVAGVRVDVGNISSITNDNGAVELVLPEGAHAPVVTTRLADGREVSQTLPPIGVSAGEVSQVIATLAPDGTIASVDVEAPGTDESPEAAQPVVAAADLPVGTVRGTVKSLEGGEPVAGARIYVRGSPVEGETDAQGKFTLELPEGEHALSIIHASFSTQTLDVVQVRPADTTELVVEMTPAGMALDDFVVTAPHIQGSVASLLDTRRESAAATDSIGAEDIRRTPANDAAGAAQRVVGATIVDGRFIYVRGLGERYTNARLNGSPLPSPEPDRATVPLDLFPAQIISRLEISKTFTPDMPADFAGGSVLIETIRVPETPIFQLSLSGGWNSQATFRQQETHEGGRWDWLGFDDGSRDLSPNIPRDVRLSRSREVSNADLDGFGPELNTNMSTKGAMAPPNMGWSLLAGRSWRLGPAVKLGVVGSFNYRRRFATRDFIVREFATGNEGLVTEQDFRLKRAEDIVRWGAFAAVTLEIAEAHTIALSGFRSQLGDKTTDIWNGYNTNSAADIGNSRLMYASRELNLLQLQGDHKLRSLADAKLEWNVALAYATRDQPDTRDIVYQRNQGIFTYQQDPDSGRHFFSDQYENSKSVGGDWTQPIPRLLHDTKIKVGGRATWKDREFRARRFFFNPTVGSTDPSLVCGETFDPRQCPADLFVDGNVMGSPLRLNETTGPNDAYTAGLNVFAGYAMVDSALTRHVRIVGGSRVEITDQFVQPFELFSGDPIEDRRADLESTDWLPAGAFIYTPREDLGFRLSISKTLARPQLRELAPFAWSDFWGGAINSGNPNLTLTSILNGDFRVEFFPSSREVLALSIFAKRFQDPIEPVARSQGSLNILSYQNARAATLYGVELEGRKELGFIANALEDFAIGANLTLATSKIELNQVDEDGSGVGFLTNVDRPMVHQAPYVVNIMLDYENQSGTMLRLLYNVSGPRIVQVGLAGLPDAYLHPVHLLDFVAGQQLGERFVLRLTVSNLLNARAVVTQGRRLIEENIVNAYRDGVTASVSLSAQL